MRQERAAAGWGMTSSSRVFWSTRPLPSATTHQIIYSGIKHQLLSRRVSWEGREGGDSGRDGLWVAEVGCCLWRGWLPVPCAPWALLQQQWQ